jgi:CCR4-NOT transcriptional regulation complex NOT5 subunit
LSTSGLAVPNTALAVPNTTLAVPNTTLAVPNTTLAVPNATLATPKTTLAIPNANPDSRPEHNQIQQFQKQEWSSLAKVKDSLVRPPLPAGCLGTFWCARAL